MRIDRRDADGFIHKSYVMKCYEVKENISIRATFAPNFTAVSNQNSQVVRVIVPRHAANQSIVLEISLLQDRPF